jgi:predicted transcriptional regulator of viral defense system
VRAIPIDCDGPCVVGRRELLAVGVTPEQMRSRLDAGLWVRLLPGAYAPAEVAACAGRDPVERARLLVAAANLRLGPCVAGHESATVLYGLPLLTEPAAVTVVRPAGRQRRVETPIGRLVVTTASLSSADVRRVDRVPVTSPARTFVDVARLLGVDDGVVVADAVLREGLATEEELHEALRRCVTWPRIRDAAVAAMLADGRAESPLESLTRIALRRQGLPPPVPQYWVVDRKYRCRYRVDLGWPDRWVVLECDGLNKYVGSPDAANALVAEKLRQERLEELGYVVVRVTWRQVNRDPARVADRVRAAFIRAGRMRQDVVLERSRS